MQEEIAMQEKRIIQEKTEMQKKMSIRKKRWVWRAAVFLTVLLLAMPVQAKAAKPKLNKTSVTLLKGSKTTLKMKRTKKKVKWSSSKKNVATVNKKGIVTARKKGTAVITAKVAGKQYRCRVTVRQPVTKIRLNRTNISLTKGKKYELKASVGPKGANDKSLVWSSSNPAVATVTKKGKVRATGVGNAVITAAARDGSGVRSSCLVMVNAGYTVPVMTIAPTSMELLEGDSRTLTVSGAVGNVVWGTSNNMVATVTRIGTVIGVNEGTATIFAANTDGTQFAYCTVRVVKSETTPSAAAYQFLGILERYSQGIKSAYANRRYALYSNSSKLTPNTWAQSQAQLNTTGLTYNNCALMIRMALREMGRLGETQNFWGTSDGNIHFNSGVESVLKQSCRIIEADKSPAQLLAEGLLLPGDICTWHGMQHTNVYAGKNAAGQDIWYDAGRGGDGEPNSSKKWLMEQGIPEANIDFAIANSINKEITKKKLFVFHSFGPVPSVDMNNWKVGHIIRIVR